MNSSPFRYPGGKSKMIPIIMEYLEPLLENENEFCDVFTGGGSVALAVAEKYPNLNIILNDKDTWIYSFWDVVSGKSTQYLDDLLKLIETPVTIELFNQLNDQEDDSILGSAYRALFFNRACFSGIVKKKDNKVLSSPIGGRQQLSKYKVNCRYNSKKLQSKIIKINKLLSGRTQVLNQDINDYLIDATCPVYCDPPYFLAGEELYSEYMKLKEHMMMADLLKKRKPNWILSYDDAPIIRELYKDNKVIDLAARYSINGVKNQWSKKNELLILGT
jgi:DNA adenine methylase